MGTDVTRPGDFLLTINANESENVTPGYWNHCAVFAGEDRVIEAQRDPGHVIVSYLPEFWKRYPKILILRLKSPGSPALADRMVQSANSLIGKDYRALVSRFRRLNRGERRGVNCVIVVRRAFRDAMDEDPGWRLPDDVAADPRFVQIEGK